MPRKVAVIGKGTPACYALDWFQRLSDDHEVIVAVPSPSVPGDRDFEAHAVDASVPIATHDELLRAELGIDLLISCGYHRLVPKELLDSVELAVNLHPGPLPRYRGVRPINWALKNGETHHGVTLHVMTPGIDDGPILAQITYPIERSQGLRNAWERTQHFAIDLLQLTLPFIHEIEPKPQVEQLATIHYHSQDDQLGEWSSW